MKAHSIHAAGTQALPTGTSREDVAVEGRRLEEDSTQLACHCTSSPSLYCTVKVCRPLCHCALLVLPSQYQELLPMCYIATLLGLHPAGPGVSVISVPCCGKSCRALCWLVEQVLGVPFPAHPPSSSMLQVSTPCCYCFTSISHCNLLQWTPKTPLLSCSSAGGTASATVQQGLSMVALPWPQLPYIS